MKRGVKTIWKRNENVMKWKGLSSFPHYKLRWNLPFSPRLLNGKIDLSDSVTFFIGKKASRRWPRNDKKERKRNSTRSSQAAKKTNLTHSYIFLLFFSSCVFYVSFFLLSSIGEWNTLRFLFKDIRKSHYIFPKHFDPRVSRRNEEDTGYTRSPNQRRERWIDTTGWEGHGLWRHEWSYRTLHPLSPAHSSVTISYKQGISFNSAWYPTY